MRSSYSPDPSFPPLSRPTHTLAYSKGVFVEKFHIMNIDVPAGVGAPPLDTQLHVHKVLFIAFLQPGH